MSQDTITRDTIKFLSNNLNIAFQYYSELDLNKFKGNNLTLLDLSANGNFQKMIRPKALADYLINSGLSENVNLIDLYISDIDLNNNLFSFAHEMANYFKEKYNRDISIRIPTALNFDYTFLLPPIISNGQWQIYGIKKTDVPNQINDLSLGHLSQIQEKQLLWQGNDLSNDWLSNPEQICQSWDKEIAISISNSSLLK